MTRIPLPALILGFAGVIPFAWGAACILYPELNEWSLMTLGSRMSAPYIQLSYGLIVLCFISGILWGFSATVEDDTLRAYGLGLSCLPTIWAFFMVGDGTMNSSINLIVGFLALLALDVYYNYLGMNPKWWLQLRIMLTILVVICLGITAFA